MEEETIGYRHVIRDWPPPVYIGSLWHDKETDMHDGEKQITEKDLTGECQRGCCGHYTDAKGRVWHKCSLWVGICLCEPTVTKKDRERL